MSDQEANEYDKFVNSLSVKYPKMFTNCYCGVSIGTGWFHIIDDLCGLIQGHINWINDTRERLLKDNPYDQKIPEPVKQVEVHQIKEKFGGLRFYYDGGDNYVQGLVNMAEAWASHTCESCGTLGKTRGGGWIRTLCDKHEEEHQARMKKDREDFGEDLGYEISEETGDD